MTLGLVLVNIFEPGTGASEDLKTSNRIRYELWRDANGIEVLDNVNLAQDAANADLVRDIQAQQEGMNAWVADKLNKAENASNSGPLNPWSTWCPRTSSAP